MFFDAAFWAMRLSVKSKPRSLHSGHRPPVAQAEATHAIYAASCQE
jgi:hypothetical protein